jgi:hypothetical protein
MAEGGLVVEVVALDLVVGVLRFTCDVCGQQLDLIPMAMTMRMKRSGDDAG